MRYPEFRIYTGKTLLVLTLLAAGMCLTALSACTEDSGEPYSVTGGHTGGVCSCDSDCDDLGDWTAFCFKGICVLESMFDCDSENADFGCPRGTFCINREHHDGLISMCALECDNNDDRECFGVCDELGICLPGEFDNCLTGCCSIADPPTSSFDYPDYPETEWEAPYCGVETYPCPPYGTRRRRVIADIAFLPANSAAKQLAGDDGILSMRDFYSADARLIVIFVTAGWCPYCTVEANILDGVYKEYRDDDRGKVMFLGVVSQDAQGYYATTDYANNYASARGWTFPAVPDVSNVINQYFLQPAYPLHIIIDGRDMTIQYLQHGALTSNQLKDRIEQLLLD